MKKFEKIIPVIAAGVIATGVNTMEAQAAELTAPEVDTTPEKREEEQIQTQAVSTSIDAAVPGEPVTNPDGSTTTEVTVNPSTEKDEGGNEVVTNDGSLTVTEQPPVTGEPVVGEPVTNPDGSTTTTTTTTTETETQIEGTVTGDPVVSTPTDEEKKDAIDSVKNPDGTWNKDKVTVDDSEEGKTVITWDTTTTVDSTLQPSELAEILKLTVTVDANGNATYTNADGQVVTVTVNNESTETTTTKWTVTVTEKTETKSENVSSGENGITVERPVTPDVSTTPNPDEEGEDSLDAEEVREVLAGLTDEQKGFLEENRTVTIEVERGAVYYDVTRTEVTETLPDGVALSDLEIFNELFAGKTGFELKADGIYKDNQKVNIVEDGNNITVTYYKTTVKKTTTTTTEATPPTVEAPDDTSVEKTQTDVQDEARKQAILDALNNALEKTEDDKLSGDDLSDYYYFAETHGWSAQVDGKDYTGTYTDGTTSVKNPEGLTPDEDGKYILDQTVTENPGYETEVSANASATVNVTEEVNLGDAAKGNATLSDSDKAAFAAGNVEKDGTFNGGKVTAVEKDNGKITSITTTVTDDKDVTTVKTYNNFTEAPGTSETKTTTTTKYDKDKGDGQKSLDDQWDAEAVCSETGTKGAWVFDYAGGVFVVKQQDGAIVWDPLNRSLSGDALHNLFNDGSMKKMPLKYADTTKTMFQIGEYVGNTSNNGAAWVEVKDGKVYVYGKDGKQDGLSHLNMEGGTITTTTGSTLSADWTASATKPDTASGTGSAQNSLDWTFKPGTDGTTSDSAATGERWEALIQGKLNYTYETPADPEIEVEAERSTERKVSATVTQTTSTQTTTTTTTPDPTPDPIPDPTPDPTPDPIPDPTPDPTPDPAPDPVPDPTPDPVPDPVPDTTPIPDAPVPQAPAPAADPAPDTVTIPDAPVPQTDAPEAAPEAPVMDIADEAVPLAEIPDAGVPLADVPRTGDHLGLWLAGGLGSALALAVTSLRRKKENEN